MTKRSIGAALVSLVALACAGPEQEPAAHDPALVEGILEDIRRGWEQGDGAPFYQGHGTYLFRWVDGSWKVVHTQSASSPVRTEGEAG